MSLKVTTRMLNAAYACPTQVRRFKREWPDGARLTLKNLLRAVELELDLRWFAAKFLSGGTYRRFHDDLERPRQERRQARADAWGRLRVKGWVRGQVRRERRIYQEAADQYDRCFARARARALFQACKTGLQKRAFIR